VDAQTWEDFVASVGGLLGVWTGASIVSFVQMFYILCTGGGGAASAGHKHKRNRQRKVVPKIFVVSH